MTGEIEAALSFRSEAMGLDEMSQSMKSHASSTRIPKPMLPVPIRVGCPVVWLMTKASVPELFIAIAQPHWSIIGLPLVPADTSKLCCTYLLFDGVGMVLP